MSEISNEKISVLQNIILERANGQKSAIAADARKEADNWAAKESEKLEREAALVVSDAKTRSEEIHRRQILSAEREKSTEALRLQNRLLQQILKKYQDELVRLRERSDYADILAGLARTAAKNLHGGEPLHLQLAAVDAPIGAEVARKVNEKIPEAKMVFDAASAPIIGGCWVSSNDGKRQFNSDWQSQTQEMADTLADRLLALL